ncbi:MAG TPA: DUF4388 domain-containing protein, partial [Kofleriaceae bacterium]|nr:DUF4388 domain-containing protein [Kofleriaceae bacterium]
VLDWAARRRISGPITFERKGVTRSLVVEEGTIVWASSDRRDEQLGVILTRSGLVHERAIAESLETRAETGVPLGKVLLMAGLIGEAELVEILATKIRETVIDVVTWTDGTFEAVPRAQTPATGVNAKLAMEVCLTIARRRAARMIDILKVLGTDDVTFYVPPHLDPPAADPGQVIDLRKIWALAGDRRTAGDIAAAFSGERFATFDALARMVESGQVIVDRRPRERTSSAAELASGARGRMQHGDRAGAYAMASRALLQDPGDGEVRKTFVVIERARVAEVAKQLLARHRVPKRLRDVDAENALGLTAAEIELAARVDGRWDLLSLIRSASVREAEALLAFSHLAEVGVVDLG